MNGVIYLIKWLKRLKLNTVEDEVGAEQPPDLKRQSSKLLRELTSIAIQPMDGQAK